MAITKNMVTQSNINMDQARRVADRYQISNIKTRIEERVRHLPTHSRDIWDETSYIDFDRYMERSHVTMLTMDIAEPEFAKMVSTLDEWDDMMRDPEAARLILEAKFIHRLRKGHI
jgi:hypothetical protein